MWQPNNWVQLMQPISSFFHQLLLRFGCNSEEQLSELQASVTSLQQAAQRFKQLETCPGDHSVVTGLNNLER